MDQLYVTADGQIAQLPRRSFLDRLTSGLYDASVEFRRPGGGQEARLARTQPLTSALNQYGQQQRGFTQEEKMLGKQQEFTAGQNTLNRANQLALADFETGRAMERARLEREARAKLAADELAQQRALTEARLAQDQSQFQATHGLARDTEKRLAFGQNLKGWDMATRLMMDMPKIQADIALSKARAANDFAQQKLYEARTSALKQAASGGLTYGQLGTISRLRPGTSGERPGTSGERPFDLFGVGGQPVAPTTVGTNALPVLNLNKRPQ